MRSLIDFSIPDDKPICDLMMEQVGLASVTVADELNIFQYIGPTSKSLTAIASEIKSDSRSTEVLLRALAAMGFMNFKEDQYSLSEIASSYLKRGSAVCRIFQFYSNRDTWAHKRILNMIKNGCDPLVQGDASYTAMWENGSLTKEAANHFTAMMNTNISAVAISIAKSNIFEEFSSVVDVGGASGIFLAAMKQRYPNKKLTLFELPLVCESAKEILKHYIPQDEIEYFPGSFFENRWPPENQAYFLSNILHDWPRPKGLEILKNARKSLAKDGSIFINEALLSSNRLAPKHTVMYDLMMHMNHGSQQYSEVEIYELIVEAGFKNPRRVFEFGYYTTIRAEA